MTDLARFDLGNGFSYTKFAWTPDRSIPSNEARYRGIPDVEWAGIILTCRHNLPGAVTFKIPGHGVYGENGTDHHAKWDVLSWEPLTINPSVACGKCGCHGWIKNGKWED